MAPNTYTYNAVIIISSYYYYYFLLLRNGFCIFCLSSFFQWTSQLFRPISANSFIHLLKKFPCGTNSRQWRDIEWSRLTLIGVDHLSHVNQMETKKKKEKRLERLIKFQSRFGSSFIYTVGDVGKKETCNKLTLLLLFCFSLLREAERMEWGQMARSCVRKRERERWPLSLFFYTISRTRGLAYFSSGFALYRKKFPPPKKKPRARSCSWCALCIMQMIPKFSFSFLCVFGCCDDNDTDGISLGQFWF